METILVNLLATDGGPKLKLILKGINAITVIAEAINEYENPFECTNFFRMPTISTIGLLDNTARFEHTAKFIKRWLSEGAKDGLFKLEVVQPESMLKIDLYGYKNTEANFIAELSLGDWSFVEWMYNKLTKITTKHFGDSTPPKVIPSLAYTDKWQTIAYTADMLGVALNEHRQTIGTYSINNTDMASFNKEASN
jgi:hypothetical protein